MNYYYFGLKNFTIHVNLKLKKNSQLIFLSTVIYGNWIITMNIYLFWILFLALWAIVPLMIIKGRKEESPKAKTAPEVKLKKKGWFS